ncbi:MAG: LLM class flavin-dependent oxidoreductase [Gammaproteobacteria bacterium]
MDFGIFHLMQQRDASMMSGDLVSDAVQLTRAAESLGFARAWFAEHHFSNYSLSPSPLMMIAHAAALTERIRLGSAVIVAPLHAPARLLGETALADTLSAGRLDLGIGNGYQQFEFERFGISMDERRERMFELLDLIEQGLGNGCYETRGVHYQLPETPINVRCVQRPHPPIWLASGDREVNLRSARNGYVPFVSSRFASRDELIPIREHIADCYRAAGRGGEAMPLGILSYCCVSERKSDIARYVEAARYQQRISRSLRTRREQIVADHWVKEQPFEDEPGLREIETNILAGAAEKVAQQLAGFIRVVHPTHMMFYFQVGGYDRAKALRSMTAWVEQVVPMVESELGCSLASLTGAPPDRASP